MSFVDLAGTFDTNNLTIARNSLKIMGQTADMTVSTEDAGIQLVYTERNLWLETSTEPIIK